MNKNKKIIILFIGILLILFIVIGIIIFSKFSNSSNINLEENTITQDNNLVSQEDEEKLLKDLYEKAYQLYGNKEYKLDKNTFITANGNKYYMAEDFYPVAQKYLSIRQIDKLKESYTAIFIKNGIIYIQDVDKNVQYQNLRLSNIQIDENSISATVTMDVYENGKLKNEDVQSKFAVIKSDNEWLIDTYYDVSEIK